MLVERGLNSPFAAPPAAHGIRGRFPRFACPPMLARVFHPLSCFSSKEQNSRSQVMLGNLLELPQDSQTITANYSHRILVIMFVLD